MKKSYQKRFDEIQLKNQYKETVVNHVLNYDVKKEKFKRFKFRLVSVSVALVLTLAVGTLIKYVLPSNYSNHFMVVKANDDIYEIVDGKIEIMDYRQVVRGGYFLGSDGSNGKIFSYPLDSPLNVTIQGENIETITYTINQGEFYKIEEGNRDEMKVGPLYRSLKEINSFPQLTRSGSQLPGDDTKDSWEFSGISNGNEITIAYEDQGTVKGFYGISFHFYDKALVSEFKHVNDASFEMAEKKLIETINQAKLNIKVHYKDGSYETTQLTFIVNDDYNTTVNK